MSVGINDINLEAGIEFARGGGEAMRLSDDQSFHFKRRHRTRQRLGKCACYSGATINQVAGRRSVPPETLHDRHAVVDTERFVARRPRWRETQREHAQNRYF